MEYVHLDDSEVFFFKKDIENVSNKHFHSVIELIYSKESSIQIKVEPNIEFLIGKDELLILPSCLKHQVHSTNKEDWISLKINIQRFYLMFTQSPYFKHIQHFYNKVNSGLILNRATSINFIEIIDKITNEYTLTNFGHIIDIIKQLNDCNEQKYRHYNVQRTNNREFELVSKIDYFIECNPSINLDIDTLAHKYNMSKSTFQRVFKRYSGVSCHKWLIAKKIGIACYKLSHTDLSIQNISDSLGFSSSSHFAREFHKYKSMSPILYRKDKT